MKALNALPTFITPLQMQMGVCKCVQMQIHMGECKNLRVVVCWAAEPCTRWAEASVSLQSTASTHFCHTATHTTATLLPQCYTLPTATLRQCEAHYLNASLMHIDTLSYCNADADYYTFTHALITEAHCHIGPHCFATTS